MNVASAQDSSSSLTTATNSHHDLVPGDLVRTGTNKIHRLLAILPNGDAVLSSGWFAGLSDVRFYARLPLRFSIDRYIITEENDLEANDVEVRKPRNCRNLTKTEILILARQFYRKIGRVDDAPYVVRKLDRDAQKSYYGTRLYTIVNHVGTVNYGSDLPRHFVHFDETKCEIRSIKDWDESIWVPEQSLMYSR